MYAQNLKNKNSNESVKYVPATGCSANRLHGH